MTTVQANTSQKITPFLWFNDQAEEAVQFYTSLFENSQTGRIARYGEGGPGPAGKVMTIEFTLCGQEFIALNGGPHYSFTPAVSFFVKCQSQEEVDALWDRLADGGQVQQCGWVTDRFGLTWQVVPTVLGEMLNDPDVQKAQRVMQAMLGMVKIEIAGLRAAYEG